MVPSEALNFEFRDLHFDGCVRTKRDLLVRVVGDFDIRLNGRVLYRETEFCLVEFGVAVAKWLAIGTDLGPNLEYTSIESDVEGLVRFSRLRPGLWRISAAHEAFESLEPATTVEIREAVLGYLRRLRTRLLPEHDILDLLEDPQLRMTIAKSLGA